MVKIKVLGYPTAVDDLENMDIVRCDLAIVIDDELVFWVIDGFLEDEGRLDQNFGDCYKIPSILMRAYASKDEAEIEFIDFKDSDSFRDEVLRFKRACIGIEYRHVTR